MSDWFDKIAPAAPTPKSWFDSIAEVGPSRSPIEDVTYTTGAAPADTQVNVRDLPKMDARERARLREQDRQVQTYAQMRGYDPTHYLEQGARSLVNAVPEVLAGPFDMIDRLAGGGEGLSGAGQIGSAIRSLKREDLPDMEKIPEGRFSQQLGGGLGMVATTVAAPELMGLKGAPAVTLATGLGAAPVAVGNYQRVLEATGDRDLAADAMLKGFGVAMAGGTLPLGRILKRIDGVTNGAFLEALGDAAVFGAAGTGQEYVNNAILEHATGEELNTLSHLAETGGMNALIGVLTSAAGHAIGMRPVEAKAKDTPPEPVTDTAPVEMPKPVEPPARGDDTPPDAGLDRFKAPAEAPKVEPTPTPVEPAPEPSPQPSQEPSQASVTPEPPPAPTPSKPEVPASNPSEGAGGPPKGVSIKNAKMAADLAELGFDPLPESEHIPNADSVEAGNKLATEDPQAARRLVEELIVKPRSIETEEGALLLNERNRLEIELNKARTERDAGIDVGTRIEDTQKQIYTLGEAAKLAGAKMGRSLQFRRAFMAEDYSYAGIERRFREANDGEPLSPSQEAEAKRAADEYARAAKAEEEATAAAERERRIADLEKTVADIEAMFAKGGKARRAAPKRTRFESFISSKAAEARARIKSGNVARDITGVVEDVAWIVAEKITNGVRGTVELTKALIEDFGKDVEPHVAAAIELGRKRYSEAVTEKLRTRVKEGTPIQKLGRYVDQITRHLVETGVRDRDALVTEVHNILKDIDPKITRAEAEDAISGYGKWKTIAKDETSVRVREIKGELQQLAKLRDMEKGLAPLKTGVERRDPTPEESRLIKKVNEKKKELGFKSVDPEAELKGALESKKTRLRNQIDDLQSAIDTREPISNEKVPTPSDAETVAMQARLDALRKDYESIFGKKTATDEQRAQASLKAAERTLAENQRRLAELDLAPKPERQGPDTPEVARIKAQRDAIRAQNEEVQAEIEHLRELAEPPKPDPLDKRIAELEAKIAAGDTSTKQPKQTVPTEKQAQLKVLQDRLAKMRADAKPKTSAEERLQKSLEKRIERLAAGIEAPGPKQGPHTAEVVKLQEELARLQAERAAARKAAKPQRTPEQRIEDAYLLRKKRELAKLYERLTYEDFIPREAKKPRELSPAEVAAKVDVERVKGQVKRGELLYKQAHAGKVAKAFEALRQIKNAYSAIRAAYDVSAIGRQALVATASELLKNPANVARAFRDSIRAMRSREFAERYDVRLRNRPGAEIAELAGLELTSIGGELGPQEEALRSKWAEKIPGIDVSNRGFITYLNALRAHSFDGMVASLPAGEKPTLERAKRLAHAANVFTGRGNIQGWENALRAASNVLWAPKLLLSRGQFLVGQPMWKGDAVTRTAILKQYARALTGMGILYSLARLISDKNEDDPRSSDFGKIVRGNTRVDMWGGLQQPVVLVSRLGSGETKSIKGKVTAIRGPDKPAMGKSAVQLGMDFVRSKFTPVLGLAADLLDQKNMVGDPVDAEYAMKAALPLPFGNLYELLKDKETGVAEDTALWLLGQFGAGVSTFETKGR